MDKFTKTTEIDISAMTEMEDETPQKSSTGKIIAMICCLILAMIIWLFVMEIDTTIQEREYNDISVEPIGNAGYTILGDLNVDVTLTGINRELADINKDDISVKLDFGAIKDSIEIGKEKAYPVTVQLSDGAGESVKSKFVDITLTINKAP